VDVGTPKKVLTIAGSDSGGGAGIQADLKTIAALGCYGLCAITALTAQNTQGVRAIHAPAPDFLQQQLDAVFEDIGADAVKIGMLHSPQIVEVVAQALLHYKPTHVVLDPVMVATSGDALITPQTQEAIIKKLFPLADVVTPNLDELSLLVGQPITRPHQFESAARRIVEMGAHAVLIKGGHLDQPNLVDVLYEMDRHGPSGLAMTEIVRPRIATQNLHGTGCTLSSAIACFLAQGYPLKAAVKGAQDYVYQAIEAAVGMQIGRGHGPVNHSFNPQPLQLFTNDVKQPPYPHH
jgi:hydroxymethylpyrimidine/phosphomethylpyrimidine kinase